MQAHLQLAFNWDRKPLYDVIVHIPGAKYPDQWVVRGNHHDAWVNGAGDPLSGASAELDEARALGELLKQGWKPDRTIIYCFWDGEEPALLGSTEWGETHAAELKEHAVAYFNSDGNGRGYFRAEGSHSLENFVNEVAKDITDPETKMNVWKRVRLADISRAATAPRAEIRSRADLRIPALGSGSDFTVFIDHLGVASVNLGYGGEDMGGGQYHSTYDDFYWFTHFEDTDFSYGRVLAQTAGTMVMRMADADVLPFQFSDQAETIHSLCRRTGKHSQLKCAISAKERDKEIDEGVYKALYDPKKQMVPPVRVRSALPKFCAARSGIRRCMNAATEFDKASLYCWGVAPPGLNLDLIQTERTLTNADGPPNRPWFQNPIYAPGFYTGWWSEDDSGCSRGH